jgi:hypothetical protein
MTVLLVLAMFATFITIDIYPHAQTSRRATA